MPIQPDMGSVHVDRALTDLSVRFTQGQDRFIANRVFPTVPVSYRSDQFFKYDRSYWFRNDVQKRGPGSESAGSGFAITTDSYRADVYAFHQDLSDQVLANAESQLALESDATEFVTTNLLQHMEQNWVTNFFTTSVWTTDKTGGTDFVQWNDAASTPIEDIRAGITTITKATSYKPNTLVLGAEVWQDGLVDHPDLLDRIKFSQKGVVTEDLLAGLLGIDRVYVAWSIKNTAVEGATGSYSFNMGKNALLCYSPPSAGLNTPAAGYTFSWTGLLGAGATGIRMKRFRLERNASTRVEGETAWDQKVISADLGYFFSGATA